MQMSDSYDGVVNVFVSVLQEMKEKIKAFSAAADQT